MDFARIPGINDPTFYHLLSASVDKSQVQEVWQIILTAIFNRKPFHVILADDDQDDRDMFTEALLEIVPMAKIMTAVDGERLLELLTSASNNPDLIFLDLNMPRKNGFDCLQEIKKSPFWKSIPVVIYSTSANTDQIERTFNTGANRYIQKPVTFDGIMSVLKKVFALKREELALQPTRDQFFFSS